jgi:flagellar protein FlgJ
MNANPLNNPQFNYDQFSNYNDLGGLQSLKHQSKTDKEGALDAAAKHFESIFVSMMIKSMRDANKVFSEGNMLQSNESDFYQQMFDSQMAVSLSTSKGIGLAEVIKRQLSKDITPDYEIGNEGLPLNPADKNTSYSLENYARQPFVSKAKVDELKDMMDVVDQSIEKLPGVSVDNMANLSSMAGVSSKSRVTENDVDFSNPDQFIASLYPLAKQVEQETGIDARLMLAQSALETGWGQHQIMKENGGPSFNLFGIKAQQDWQGEAAEITTTEYRQGVAMKERANFRAYDSYGESFEDYAQFLKNNERYQHALEFMDDPKAFAEQLQSSGYATDPQYANKIHSIMDRYLMPDLGMPTDELAR